MIIRRNGFTCSADTILRVLRQSAVESGHDVKVLGVDDWAWHRGHRYGTVLVDLERHQPIDLLTDRQSETLAEWLRAHPTVRIISRDRAGAYAEGARQGAPGAVQIADRFHLFCNLTQVLQRVLERLAGTLHRIQMPEPPGLLSAPEQTGDADTGGGVALAESGEATAETPARLNQHERERQQHREKRKARFDAVNEAYQRGLTKRAIARQLGITRTTVRRYLKAKEFPERAPRQRRSALDEFRGYLETRWAEGCHNASQLCRELRKLGYCGQRSRVKEYVQSWRAKPEVKMSRPRRRRTLPNLKLVAFWLTKPPAQRSPEEQRWVEAVTAGHPQVAAIEDLAQQFRQVFRERDPRRLRSWLNRSIKSGVPEMRGFVTGIRRDREAVTAAVKQHWSNGQVEGQVHRIKLLKRQMYGRSGFLLLRRRVLPFRVPRPGSSP